ncbi:9711_t:CDS:2, partial [Racocetra fulgida]
IWKKPTIKDFNTKDFKWINSSINWSKVPNIAPRKMVNGDIDMTGYPDSDPDCTWGLTYDDGPSCAHTVFYDFLRDNNQSATMFFIGSNVATLPHEARRAYLDVCSNLTTIITFTDTNDWNMEPDGTEQPAQIDATFQSFIDMGQNGTFADSGAIVLEHELNNGTMSKAIE